MMMTEHGMELEVGRLWTWRLAVIAMTGRCQRSRDYVRGSTPLMAIRRRREASSGEGPREHRVPFGPGLRRLFSAEGVGPGPVFGFSARETHLPVGRAAGRSERGAWVPTLDRR